MLKNKKHQGLFYNRLFLFFTKPYSTVLTDGEIGGGRRAAGPATMFEQLVCADARACGAQKKVLDPTKVFWAAASASQLMSETGAKPAAKAVPKAVNYVHTHHAIRIDPDGVSATAPVRREARLWSPSACASVCLWSVVPQDGVADMHV
jgi:hypothetical protein